MYRSIALTMLGGLLAVAAGMATHARAGEAIADSSLYQDIERFEDGDASSGAKLYKRYCRGCHGEDGRGGAHTFMPHIENLTKKGYIEHLTDGYLFLVIADGGEAVGKSSYMPAWKVKLDDQAIKDIVTHIRAMPTY
ncbi:MAG: c-type cytochrome [Geminicoccaceae bacterium]